MNDLGSTPLFTAIDEIQDKQVDKTELPTDYTHEKALHFILHWIEAQNQNWQVSTVAHRIVHGGEHFKASVRITPEIISQLRELCPLAPLHQPHNLAGVEMMSTLRPDVIQIACFDTAFHANHEPLFTEYALPQTMRDQGIRRYGFSWPFL